MTTITDDLAAREMQDALIRAKMVLETVARDRMKHGTISTAALQACHQVKVALAKYETAKVQEPKSICSTYHSRVLNGNCSNCGHSYEVHGHAQKPHAENGFPVVKVPGHVVNHMEWIDHALIVSVGPRRTLEPSDMVKLLRRRAKHVIGCEHNKCWPTCDERLFREAADRLAALEAQ